jgi:hypothetical protein
VRPGDGAAGGRDRRRRRRDGGLGRADRRADARPDRPRDAGGRGAHGGAPRDGRDAAPDSARDQLGDEAPGRLVRPLPRRSSRGRGAGGPGPGRAVRHPRRLRAPGQRRAPRGRFRRLVPSPCGRHPRRAGVRRRRPCGGPPHAAVGAGEHRPAVHGAHRPVGADRPARGAAEGRPGGHQAADRRPRRKRGPPALRRQPAEGDDRAVGRRRRPYHAVLRPDPRDRHQDQAADLPPAPRPRRSRGGGAPLHLGAEGGAARVRPRDRDLRRAGGGRGRRRGRGRGDAPARCLPPAVDAPMPEQVAGAVIDAASVDRPPSAVAGGPEARG